MNVESLCIVLVVIAVIIAAVIAGHAAFVPTDDHHEGASHD